MTTPIAVNAFRGIAPRFGKHVRPGHAQTAENVDLTDNKIKPTKEESLVETSTTKDNFIFYHNSAWEKGRNGYFLEWQQGALEVLVYLVNGVPYKKCDGVTALLGQTRAGAPTAASQSVGIDLTDGVTYRWTASGSGTNEYYCELIAGGDPSLVVIFGRVTLYDVTMTIGTLGSLSAGYWGYGDNDTLGFNTVYVRLPSGVDPDTLATESIELIYDLFSLGDIEDTVRYIITTNRDVGGHIDESGPSAASDQIVAGNNRIRVTPEAITDTLVTSWNLYRIGNLTGEYQLVIGYLDVSETYYDDTLANSALGASPTTWYTSDATGTEIFFDKPLITFGGLIDRPKDGMIFAWKNNVLYWCEPGAMDAWPTSYYLNFPANIRRVIAFMGYIVVLTEIGPYPVGGDHPEGLTQGEEVLGTEPCLSSAACPTPKGVAYLSDSGIVLCNGQETIVATDRDFTEQWFKDNVAPSSATLIENDGILYLFHSGGMLAVDARTKTVLWTTSDIVVTAAHKRRDTGALYVMDSIGIKLFGGSTSDKTFTWTSGHILGIHPMNKPFSEVEARGSGTVTITLYVDDIQQATKALSWVLDRDRILKLPVETMGRALTVEFSGTGEVTEFIARYTP